MRLWSSGSDVQPLRRVAKKEGHQHLSHHVTCLVARAYCRGLEGLGIGDWLGENERLIGCFNLLKFDIPTVSFNLHFWANKAAEMKAISLSSRGLMRAIR